MKIYGLVIGQCTPALRSTLKGDDEYNNKSESFDALWLMKKLQTVTAGMDLKANLALTLHEQLIIFFMTCQGQTESDNDYLVRFNARFKSLKNAGGAHLFCSPTLLRKKISEADDVEIEAKKERFKAMCFLQFADEHRYTKLID